MSHIWPPSGAKQEIPGPVSRERPPRLEWVAQVSKASPGHPLKIRPHHFQLLGWGEPGNM
jgi:hypothetical protein